MSTTRLVSIDKDGTPNAYRGHAKQGTIKIEPGSIGEEYLEYFRKYPDATIQSLQEDEDGETPSSPESA